MAGEQEINAAVEAAEDALQTWRTIRGAQRGRLLFKLADLIEDSADEFGRLGAFDNGTPVSIVGGLVERSVAWTRYYAGWADKISGDVTPSPAASSWATRPIGSACRDRSSTKPRCTGSSA
jgi:aldehyde dehydrogenase (NAD+)